MQNERMLDQAIDPDSQSYKVTADHYTNYLERDYGANHNRFREKWRKHFSSMRARFNGFIAKNIINDGVARLEDLDIAIVGPGLKPVGRDFGNTACEELLPSVRNVVTVDFSAPTVRAATEDLLECTQIQSHRLLPMQFDMTDGLSAAWENYIADTIEDVDNEPDLADVANNLRKCNLDQLEHELLRRRGEIWDIFSRQHAAALPDVLIGGGTNNDRTLRLSVDGEPLDMQAWYLPMLIAGTGAAAEDAIWKKFNSITTKKSDSSVALHLDTRIQAIRDFYSIIAKYNTLVASTAFIKILSENERAQILAVTDVSTMYKNEYKKAGELERLQLTTLEEDLSSKGITLNRGNFTWCWEDQEDHGHMVRALLFTKNNGTSAAVSADLT